MSSSLHSKLANLPSLDDANDAGTKNSNLCTLILTQGDVVKAFAVAGLSVVGRDHYGVLPVRGMLLNVREASHREIIKNTEVDMLVKILGLQYKKDYQTADDLKTRRYGKVMIMAEQDQDGSRFKALVISFFHHFWPSLLRHDFLEEFIPPIVSVSRGKEEVLFYSMPEYQEWKNQTADWTKWKIKNFISFGSSTGRDAKNYFSNKRRRQIKFNFNGHDGDNAFDLAFSKKRMDDRKDWLTAWEARNQQNLPEANKSQRVKMDSSKCPKRRKLSPSESVKPSPTSSKVLTHDTSISHLPKELLSAIVDYVPKTQWPSLELVNRSFRDAVYSSWQSVREFDMDKDVLGISQSFNGARLSDFLPSILAKLQLRSPMLTSIIGFPSIYQDSEESMVRYRSEILHIVCHLTNLKRIDFGALGLKSVDLVEFLTTSASRDRLVEISSSADYYLRSNEEWPAIFNAQATSESQLSRLKLEKLSLKNEHPDSFLDPKIIDQIDPSSLTILILDKISAPSDYLLSLITNCNQLQQLQFSFLSKCQCKETPCVHLTSSKQILEAIAAIESLNSLKIGMMDNGDRFNNYLDIEDELPIWIDHLGRRGRLVEFGLLHEDYCSDKVIKGIGKHLADLKSLELVSENCRPATLVRMIKKMVSLEKLKISYDEDDFEPTNNPIKLAMATRLPYLRSFCLRLPLDIDCLPLLTRMEHLEELTIVGEYSHKIKWESGFGHQLQSLELRKCSEEFVAAVLKQTPGLRRLVLSESFHLSNTVLRMIPSACPQLREFYMYPLWANTWTNTMEGVKAIIDGCPELQQLRY